MSNEPMPNDVERPRAPQPLTSPFLPGDTSKLLVAPRGQTAQTIFGGQTFDQITASPQHVGRLMELAATAPGQESLSIVEAVALIKGLFQGQRFQVPVFHIGAPSATATPFPQVPPGTPGSIPGIIANDRVGGVFVHWDQEDVATLIPRLRFQGPPAIMCAQAAASIALGHASGIMSVPGVDENAKINAVNNGHLSSIVARGGRTFSRQAPPATAYTCTTRNAIAIVLFVQLRGTAGFNAEGLGCSLKVEDINRMCQSQNLILPQKLIVRSKARAGRLSPAEVERRRLIQQQAYEAREALREILDGMDASPADRVAAVARLTAGH